MIPRAELARILKALAFAAEKHRDQRRKDEGASPYINHPIALADGLVPTQGQCGDGGEVSIQGLVAPPSCSTGPS